jgi:hypothetical protein
MTFAAPLFLLAAGIVSGIVGLLHLISFRSPGTEPLPTARFVPDRDVRARRLKVRPQDLLLLALRIGVVMAVGLGLARPRIRPLARQVVRIVAVDRSRGVTEIGQVSDSAQRLLGEGDRLILFDSAARLVADHALDSLRGMRPSGRRGSLSAALVVALRTASLIREEADSMEVDLISPFIGDEIDDATDSVRALWPAAIGLVRVPARRETRRASETVEVLDAASDDPLRVALGESHDTGRETVHIVRRASAALDSAWVRVGPRVLILWPDEAAAQQELSLLGSPWTVRSKQDTVGAVSAAGAVVVAPFVRYASIDTRRQSAGVAASPTPEEQGRVVARWVDGEPAAVERRAGQGCIRTVAIPVPRRGDLVLTPRFARLAASLTGPCDGPEATSLSDARLESLARPTLRRRAAASTMAGTQPVSSSWVVWLLGLGLAGILTERLVRDRRRA